MKQLATSGGAATNPARASASGYNARTRILAARSAAFARLEMSMNKRKKVALHKHRVKRKKLEEKRRISGIARRK